jgi:hypothetical protein
VKKALPERENSNKNAVNQFEITKKIWQNKTKYDIMSAREQSGLVHFANGEC